MSVDLPPLPLSDWEATKTTLHLWAQIVGKVRLASTAPRNHWWHVPLYLDVRGLTTRRMHAANGVAFEIVFDFVDHRLVVTTNGGASESFELVDGLSVAEFDERLHATLARLGIDVAIRELPFGVPMKTPFPDDAEHCAYDRDAVERFWRILDWTDGVLRGVRRLVLRQDQPGARVLAQHGSRRHPLRRQARARIAERGPGHARGLLPRADLVRLLGGRRNVREPTFYSYTAPEPAGNLVAGAAARRRLLD